MFSTKEYQIETDTYYDENSPSIKDGLLYNFNYENNIRGFRNYNIIDYSTWVVGTSGSQPGFTQNGSTSENNIILDYDPFGNLVPIWNSFTDVTSDADGGFVTNASPVLDNTKKYRMSVWMRRKVIGNGQGYAGLYGYSSADANVGVANILNGAISTNPYFWYGIISSTEWRLYVGHVWPYGTVMPGTIDPESGIYNINERVSNITTDWVFLSTTTKLSQRAYLYYSTDITTNQQFCYPRIDLIDGTEPTIEDLLKQEGKIYNIGTISNAIVDKYGLNVDRGTTNLVINGNGSSINPSASVPGVYNPGWDTRLHNLAIIPTYWSSGYNSGAPSPTIGYHAHWRYDYSEGFAQAIGAFIDKNDKYGLGHRWMGITETMGTATDLGIGTSTTITISWDQKVSTIDKPIRVGLYHRKVSTGTYDFESNISSIYSTKIDTWERLCFTTTTTTNWDVTGTVSVYFYGHYGDYGEAFFKNVQIEIKNFNTAFTPTTRAAATKVTYPMILARPYTIHLDFTRRMSLSESVNVDGIFELNNNVNNLGIWKRTTENYIRIRINSNDYSFPTSAFIKDTRNKLTLSMNASSTNIYLNGEFLGNHPYVMDIIQQISLGGYGGGSTQTGSNVFHNVLIYNKALNADEVKILCKSPFNIKEDSIRSEDFKEKQNLIAPPYIASNLYSPYTGAISGIYYVYQQNDNKTSVVKSTRQYSNYGFSIYRTPNIYYGAGTIAININSVSGSNIITMYSGNTSVLYVNDRLINGPFPNYTYITGITDSTHFTISVNATATNTNDPISVTRAVMWGGINLNLSESCKTIGNTYKISFWVKGQTSVATDGSRFNYTTGWDSSGIGLISHGFSYDNRGIAAGFVSKEWVYKEAIYTVDNTRWVQGNFYCNTVLGSDIVTMYSGTYASSYMIIGDTISGNSNIPVGATVIAKPSTSTFQISSPATATATNVLTYVSTLYDTYKEIKLVGWGYNNTGALGTVIFLDELKIEDITGKTNVPLKIKEDGIETVRMQEGKNYLYCLGSASASGGPIDVNIPREFSLNGISTTPAAGRGLTLITWDYSGTILSNTRYDTYGVDADRISLAAALLAIEQNTFWVLLSYDANNTNATLTTQMTNMRATQFIGYNWATYYRSPYAAFGKGQQCIKEDLRTYGIDRWYATLSLYY